jgi:hypothetical protein
LRRLRPRSYCCAVVSFDDGVVEDADAKRCLNGFLAKVLVCLFRTSFTIVVEAVATVVLQCTEGGRRYSFRSELVIPLFSRSTVLHRHCACILFVATVACCLDCDSVGAVLLTLGAVLADAFQRQAWDVRSTTEMFLCATLSSYSEDSKKLFGFYVFSFLRLLQDRIANVRCSLWLLAHCRVRALSCVRRSIERSTRYSSSSPFTLCSSLQV